MKKKFHISGALDDFDAGNAAKGTEKSGETTEANASAEVWNEEFIS